MNRGEVLAEIGSTIVRQQLLAQSLAGTHRVVIMALRSVPKDYLAGLSAVILRDVKSITSSEKRWKTRRKANLEDCLGLYIRGQNRRRPTIHLFIDNILNGTKYSRCVPLVKTYVVSRALFHELGHHIHWHLKPSRKDPEEVADYYQSLLLRKFFGSPP